MSEGKNLIGVDIGTSSIKVCQLKEARKGFVLAKMGVVDLPHQAIVDGQVMEESHVVEALSRVIKDSKVRGKNIALSISGQAVIIRKITMPLMDATQLADHLQWEAEQHIPFDIKDVYVDHEVLSRRPEAAEMDVLLVAAKREEVDGYVKIAKAAKLKPLTVDVDAFCVQNLFEINRGLPSDSTVSLINVGAHLASINIISAGVSTFTRDIAHGGYQITDQLHKQLGMTFEEAELLKLDFARAKGIPEAIRVMESVCDNIAGEIQRSLDFYLATSGDGEIAKIYLTGGVSNLGSLSSAIGRRSRVAVEALQPFEAIAVESDINQDVLRARAAQLSVSLGLSLRREKERRAA